MSESAKMAATIIATVMASVLMAHCILTVNPVAKCMSQGGGLRECEAK